MRRTFQPGLFRFLFSHTFRLYRTELPGSYMPVLADFLESLMILHNASFSTLHALNANVCPDSSCPITIRTITKNRDRTSVGLGPGLHFLPVCFEFFNGFRLRKATDTHTVSRLLTHNPKNHSAAK